MEKIECTIPIKPSFYIQAVRSFNVDNEAGTFIDNVKFRIIYCIDKLSH